MLTPELHISTDFIANDHIGSETFRAYCAELKKTKVVIFALCVQGRLKAMINLVHYNIGAGTMIAIPSESFIQEEFYKLKYCSTVVYMVPRA